MLTHTEDLNAYVAALHPTNSPYAFQSARGPAWLFTLDSKEKSFGPSEEIFGEGEPVDCIYEVVQGTVRSYRMLGDGRRKIDAFRLRGDIFGFETGEERASCAEAIGDVRVRFARRCTLARDRPVDGAGWELWAIMTAELQRVQKHALLLAKSAQERVAGFLIEMSRRLDHPDALELPMSRQDIADHLGLTIETVSRTLTQFEAKGIIARPTMRQITLLDLTALRLMSG
jgi:CRP/FNR family nitrogen fixation transcriptional regulator